MFKKISVVAASEGIIVRGLETKLKGIGVEPVFSTPKLSELQAGLEGAALIILFIDDNVEKMAESLVFIKDHCAEHDVHTIIIADKDGYEAAAKLISGAYILDCFSRPIDMDKLLNMVESYLEKESQLEKRKSILIVDDDVSYMSMIMDWLKDKYRVSLANSGMDAITWLAGNHADLILLDYEMPITSGPQVLQMIRSSVKTADLPVMFLTGKGDKESIMAVLSLKPAGYLLKTVDKNGLHENLDKFFASEKGKI